MRRDVDIASSPLRLFASERMCDWLYLVNNHPALQDDRPLARKQVGIGKAEIDVERRLVLPAEVAILAERDDQRAMAMLVHQRPSDRTLEVGVEANADVA